MPPQSPPQSLCLLRLSALGDAMNVVPLLHTIRRHWPDTRITWIIGAAEARLVGGLEGVAYLIYDKASGVSGRRALAKRLAGKPFDVLCHLHAGWRANLVSRTVRADLKLGFNRERSRDLQRWFVDRSIGAPGGAHVVDGFFAFLETLGLSERLLDWSLPVSPAAREQAAARLPAGAPWLLISPASSHPHRNWRAERYAAVAEFAARERGMQVALIGGPAEAERELGAAIAAQARVPVVNLIGDAPLPLLVALLARARVLVTPDSGPAHIANAARIPVVALHAATEAARSGPYLSLDYCVDRFDAAARKFLRKPAAELPWGTKIERPGVMDLITVDAVIERLDAATRAGIEKQRIPEKSS